MLSSLKLLEGRLLHNANTPVPGPVGQDGLLSTLMQRLVVLSETTNRILDQQSRDLVDKVNRIDANLSVVAAQAENLTVGVESGRTVALQALARIEGKKVSALLTEADNLKTYLLQTKNELYRSGVKGKQNIDR